jgi:agmatine/peptidylarginine deiminase
MNESSQPILPAEWSPQCAVMLTWPHEDMDCAPYLAATEAVFAQIGRAVLRHEDLLVVIRNDDMAARVRAQLGAAGPGRLHLAQALSNDVWARDHGPITVFHEGRPRLLDFRFNGWGGKFDSTLDDAITAALQRGCLSSNAYAAVPMVLEGGAIEVDGQGYLLARESCLIDERRNLGWTRIEVTQALHDHLGVEHIHWLRHGHLEGDDTDAHIDTLARFADPHTIVFQACDDATDAHHAALQAMAQELAQLRTAQGQPYRLVPLPWPQAIYDPDDGRRLPASYANFLIINGAVLLPVYGDAADEIAGARLREAFPGREIIPIDCRALIRQSGSLHCVTMQLPQGLRIN